MLIHVSHYQQVLRVHEISLFSTDFSIFLLIFSSGAPVVPQWCLSGAPVVPNDSHCSLHQIIPYQMVSCSPIVCSIYSPIYTILCSSNSRAYILKSCISACCHPVGKAKLLIWRKNVDFSAKNRDCLLTYFSTSMAKVSHFQSLARCDTFYPKFRENKIKIQNFSKIFWENT